MSGSQKSNSLAIGALHLALIPIALLTALSFVPRIRGDTSLTLSFWTAAGALFVFFLFLRRQALRSGRSLVYEFLPSKVHYVQAAMQSCIYVYWGMYWPEVYRHVWLIAAQIIFVYGLDMLVCWSRRDKWILGFGPFPIILSTNLFLWYKDDWFFLQFLMAAIGVLCKEFVKWHREGRVTHIFNPSAIALSLFSVGLLVAKSTPITWGEEIATTLHRPPHIYIEIFLVGLVVQALFSVTLVTLWAAAALFALNLAYTYLAGGYHFIDSNIPVSVFLGLHLLVTDPATSPRTGIGKVLFGGLYGTAVFGMYGLLSWMSAPTFYDKLLCVPLLNLCVPGLDWLSQALANRFRIFDTKWLWNPQKYNVLHMTAWGMLFVSMLGGGFLVKGKDHPGSSPAFWENACRNGKWNGCKTWIHVLNVSCRAESAVACFSLGEALGDGRVVAKDPLESGKALGRACDLGLKEGCTQLAAFVDSGGGDVFLRGCQHSDGASCFVLGSLAANGLGVPQDRHLAFDLFNRSCNSRWPRGCGRLGESYLWGEGTSVDFALAMQTFEKACADRFAPGCFNAAMMFRRGLGASKDASQATVRFRRACELGLQLACERVASDIGSAETVGSENRN